jgi:hypothetical protein
VQSDFARPARQLALSFTILDTEIVRLWPRATVDRGENMTFKAYIDNIHAKTGKRPDDFRKIAEQKGFVAGGTIRNGVKAGEIVEWLKADFDLGRGHAMAIYALLKGQKEAGKSSAKKTKAAKRP